MKAGVLRNEGSPEVSLDVLPIATGGRLGVDTSDGMLVVRSLSIGGPLVAAANLSMANLNSGRHEANEFFELENPDEAVFTALEGLKAMITHKNQVYQLKDRFEVMEFAPQRDQSIAVQLNLGGRRDRLEGGQLARVNRPGYKLGRHDSSRNASRLPRPKVL